MKSLKVIALVLLLLSTFATITPVARASSSFRLGNEVLLEKHRHLIEGKRIGLVTNQSGVNSKGESLIDILANDKDLMLTALYGPEHGIDGKAAAGAYVESYTHPTLNIPVYSLYGSTRKPTPAMLTNIDVLLFDIQDIGARTYTYISTMNYAMIAAKENNKPFIVLDRPNPLGGIIVEGPVLEDGFKTFVGVDNLPMAHGMTIGELAFYFNRLIGADLTVITMEGYSREMIYQDTGLPWVQTSPNIPNIDSVFGYMATGLGEGTGIGQQDKFKFIGGANIDPDMFAAILNTAKLSGVQFIAERFIRSNGTSVPGVRLLITDFKTFNPAKSGLYALFYARSLCNFSIPKSGPTLATMVMFDKVMGTNQVGVWLEKNYSPQQMEAAYTPGLNAFKKERVKYLLYGYVGNKTNPSILVNGRNTFTDVKPFISNARTLVPVRAIAENLGAEVEWFERDNSVTITKDAIVVRLVLNSRAASVNGAPLLLDVAPIATAGRTFLPVRFVSEYLGAEVDWQGDRFAVAITTR
ncbi:MAG: DUF1343 domain-containing protein [Peptococcaceae bacterium]|nr:DUF1343 domain-containing protein [Peptococcaceae bacterium]